MGLLQSLQGFLGITANRERKKAEENLARANAKMASTPAKYGVLKDDRRRQSFAQGNTLQPYRSPYSQILDQYNPLDNGRTMANPTPQNSLSSAKQLLGIANSFKESMAQPYRYVGDASGRAIDYATGGKLDEATRRLNESNALLTKTYADLRKARYQPRNLEQAIKENALNQSKTSRKIDTETQATIDATNKRRFLASVGEIGFDVATVGTGATAAKGTRTALNQAVKTGALQGGTSGAFSGLGQKEVTPQSILASTGMGVAFGGALPVAGYGLKVGGKKLISGVNGLDDAGSIPINKGAVGKNVNKGVGDPLESLKQEADPVFGKDGKAWQDYNKRYSGLDMQTAKSEADFNAVSRGDPKVFDKTPDAKRLQDVISGDKKVGYVDNQSYDGLFAKKAQEAGLYTREMNGVTVAGKNKADVDRYVAQGKNLSKQEEHNLIGYKPERFQPKPPKPKIPTVKQVASGAPTVADRTDQIYKTLGVDTQEGLVKGNFLYNNPVVSTYNRAQQGIRNYIDSVSDAGVSKYEQALNSDNAVIAGAARTPRGFFNNVGRSEAARTALTKRTSSIEMSGGAAKAALKDINEVVAQMPDQSKHFKRIYQVLEDGDFLQKVYGSRKKVSASKLNPQEKVAFNKLVELNKIRNDINLETGQITKAFHDKYKDGLHSPRVYDLKAKKANKGYGSGFLDDSASKQRKDILMMDEKITSKTLENPYLASVGRLELALRNKADLEALADLSKANQIFSYPPNKNFIKLGERYGKYKGKYVDKQLLSQLEGKDYFNTSVGQGVGDLTRRYAQSPLGQADKTIKTAKTALAPAVGVGNVSSDIVAFSGAANVNPATTAVRMAQAGKQLYKASKGFDSNVYRAEKAGLFSGNTGKQLLGLSDTEVAIRAKSSKNPVKAAASLYGNTDRAAALGLFNELKARGLSDAKAVRRVHSAMQNYDNAGRAINTLADAPILGKPFARFSPELIRIAKNNLKYNPVGTAVKVGGLATGLTALSKKVGETEEERKAREEAVGQTQLPGTRLINKVTGGPDRNVSLNAAIGGSSVNASRLLGLNFPIEPGGNSNTSLVRQLSPLADFTRTTADGKEVFAPNQAVSSLLFKPIADQLANRDFMGRQISDPENKVRSEIGAGKSQFENADGTRQSPGKAQEIRNRLKALGGGYIPGFQEFNSIYSSQKGEKDLYGKVRTPTQGILRAGGLKVESNDKDAREKRVSNADFFEGKDKQVKQFLKDNPDKANDYFKFNDSSRDRFTNKKSSGLVTPEKWSIIKAQTDNKLFNQLKQEALDENTKSKKPIDPIFKLDTPAKVKEAISIRSMNPGENVEREEILRATTKWYKKYENNERKYYRANSAFFDKIPKSDNPSKLNDRVKKWVDVPYTEQTKLASKYLTLRYGDKEKGIKPNEQAGKDFYKANADQLSKDFSAYKDARLKEINAKRAVMDLKPLDKKVFNNVTFGYESDEDKVATELYFKNKDKNGYSKSKGKLSGKGGSAKYSSAYSDIIADIGSLNKKTSKLKVKGSNLKVKKTALKTYTVAKNKGVT